MNFENYIYLNVGFEILKGDMVKSFVFKLLDLKRKEFCIKDIIFVFHGGLST